MSFRQITSLGALIGMMAAFAVYALLATSNLWQSIFPQAYAHSIDTFCYYAQNILWPRGSGFLSEISYRHVPTGSLAYLGLLIDAVLWNGVHYSVIAAACWLCMRVGKIGILIPILAVLDFSVYVLHR
jgi:hypothetical protein